MHAGLVAGHAPGAEDQFTLVGAVVDNGVVGSHHGLDHAVIHILLWRSVGDRLVGVPRPVEFAAVFGRCAGGQTGTDDKNEGTPTHRTHIAPTGPEGTKK